MEAITGWFKMIFIEKHEVVYNVMMIIMGIIVYILISWLRQAYKILESGTLPVGDPEVLKKFSKNIDAMFAEAKNLTTNLNRKVDDLYTRINKWDTQIITLQKGAEELKKLIENVPRAGGQSGKAEGLLAKIQEEHEDLLAKIGTLQKGAEETKKQIENMPRADGQNVQAEEVLYKMQEEHKELFTNINKRIEDLYDKTRRFNEWLVNSQKQLEASGKVLTKMQDSLTEISKLPRETKAPELDKFAKDLEENSQYVHKVNAAVEHMHNKMIEHEDQINDLKRIFEDMDATFAEMNKRFQKIETVERGN
ncbi:MAG: hypothetical protein HY920_08785 [Elusimicrobia bacterium]|nr:hypothetical protein [Elusimicrobiota bacterium]